MATSRRHQDLREPSELNSNAVHNVFHAGMEWQTPVLSEKRKSRHSRRPSTADSGDTAVGTSCSDSIEDLCGSSSSSFQPIKTQVTIPTAHVMPSTVSTPPFRMQVAGETGSESASSPSENMKISASLSRLTGMHPSATDTTTAGNENSSNTTKTLPGDPLSFYRTGSNCLDHSLFKSVDQSRLDEVKKFDTPAIEPTLNQSGLLDTFYSDPRYRLHLYREEIPAEMKENSDTFSQMYKALPETQLAQASGNNSGQQTEFRPSSKSTLPLGFQPCGVLSTPQSAMWLQNQILSKPDMRPPELGAWQQQQQIENIRLQVEQMQLMNGISHPNPSVYPTLLHQDSSRWDLLKEKERVIERQTQQISHLEQKLWERELQVHNTLIGHAAPYNDLFVLRLQEAQREAMFLRAQFAELKDSFTKEKNDLDRKLGEAEAEVRQMKESLKEMTQKHSEEVKKQEERVRGREKYISSLKKKMQKELDQNREKQQRIETLERYLADLPTLEDCQKQTQQVKELELQKVQLQDTVRELEGKLGETLALCQKKDSQLETQKRKELELISTVHSLQEKIEQTLRDGSASPALEMEKLRSENSSLKEECDRARKMVEKQQKRMEQLTSQIRSLEQRVAQEEGATQALREELNGKENGLQQLRVAVKELSAQNQDLMERNLTLQERLGQTDYSTSLHKETFQLTRKLHTEMFICLHHLQSVCNILMQRTQGKDPNLSLLLGIQSVQCSGEEDDNWQSPELLNKKLSEVRQLHSDIEELRAAISDRYAQDVGENCITQ